MKLFRQLKCTALTVSALASTLTVHSALADIRLPQLLSDGVVLQRDTPINIWGWADKGESIDIYINGNKVAHTKATDSEWETKLPPMPAGGPHEIKFVGKNSFTLNEVWIGDVWIAAGQSNMELPMERVKYTYTKEISNANNPIIRQFKTPRGYNFYKPQNDFYSGSWIPAKKDQVNQFTAVGYFFAKAIHEQYGIPIGIINTAVGGSKAESWMSEKTLKAYPNILKTAFNFRKPGYLEELIKKDENNNKQWFDSLNHNDIGLNKTPPWYASSHNNEQWESVDIPGYWEDTNIGAISGTVWFKKTIELPEAIAKQPAKLWLGAIVDADITYVNGVKVGETTYKYPPRRYTIAPGVLKPGKNTITVRAISKNNKGAFIPDKPYWLEVAGERFSLEGKWQYKIGAITKSAPPKLFWDFQQALGFYNAMLAPVTKMNIAGVIWYQGESNVGRAQEYETLLPDMISQWREDFNQGDFPFLIVQLASFLPTQEKPVESEWAELREAQRKALRSKNTAMAVAIDAGEWNDIHPLNKKVIGDRLALAARKVAYKEENLVYSGPIIKCMAINNETVELFFNHIGQGLQKKGKKLEGFAIAGRNGNYRWTNALLHQGHVTLKLPKNIKRPISVRYAWADNPDKANLYNEAGLPASPFQTSKLCDAAN